MKYTYYIIIALLLCICACSSLTSAERAERDAKIAQSVEKALAERQYKVEIHTMFPRRGQAVNVTPDYSLQVKGDTLVSYLPYFGRAYSVPYGGGKGLNFTAPIKEYQVVKGGRSAEGRSQGKKGNTKILIRVDSGEDIVTYTLDVFPNGNTSINVSARERESISYSGELDVE